MKVWVLNAVNECLLNAVNGWILEDTMCKVWNTGLWTQLIRLWNDVWMLNVWTLNTLELKPGILKIILLSLLSYPYEDSISCETASVSPFVVQIITNKCLGTTFKVGDSQRKDACDYYLIRLSLQWIRVIMITHTTPAWRLWSLLHQKTKLLNDKKVWLWKRG